MAPSPSGRPRTAMGECASHEDQDPTSQEFQVASEGRQLPDRQVPPPQEARPQPPQAQAPRRRGALITPNPGASMTLGTEVAATLDDLARVDGMAELVGGRIIRFVPTGHLPNYVASEIFDSLRAHAQANGDGLVYTDNIGFAIREISSGRQSFSPDVSYFEGPLPRNWMRFIEGPPTFAVEVRSEGDYGPTGRARDRGQTIRLLRGWDDSRLGCRPDRRDDYCVSKHRPRISEDLPSPG